MNNKMLKLAKELAVEIRDSETMSNLKAAEKKIHENHKAQKLLEDYFSVKRDHEFNRALGDKNKEESLSIILDHISKEIENNPDANEFLTYQREFDRMMGNINHILKFSISGECEGCNKCSL